MDLPNSFSNPSSCGSTSGGKKKRGARLSTDPQSVAARQRRHRISDRFKILQSMVPGGAKMDTVSMLEEAIQYVKFLKTQIWLHQAMISLVETDPTLHPAVLPFYCSQNADEVAGVGWSESWLSGEGGFDARPWGNNIS